MFKAKLKAVYQDLTQSEKLVADYILEHIDEIKTITSPQYPHRPVHDHPLLAEARLQQLPGTVGGSVGDPAAGSGAGRNSGQRIDERYQPQNHRAVSRYRRSDV